MTAHQDTGPNGHSAPGHQSGQDHGSRKSYLIGFLLSAILTAVPFYVVMSGAMTGVGAAAVIIVFAFLQIAVHTLCFLHVNTRAEGGWTLLAFVFTGVMVVIVIAGSLWIMYHLHGNMMPMSPQPLVEPAAPVPATQPVLG